MIVDLNLYKGLPRKVNRWLADLHAKHIFTDNTILDATKIESAARPRRVAKVMAEDRNEYAVNCEDVEYARDKDARWLKKGHRRYFGYIRVMPAPMMKAKLARSL